MKQYIDNMCKASCMLLLAGGMTQAYALTIKDVAQTHENNLKAQHTLKVVTDGTTANYDYVWYVAGALQSSNASSIVVSTGIQPKTATVTAYSKTDEKRVNPLATKTFTVEAEQYAEKHIIADGYHGGSGTKSDPYMISNAAELSYFSSRVSGQIDKVQNEMTYYKNGNSYEGKYFCLSNDINLKDAIWHPIGAVSSSSNAKIFSGNFDGAGFSVINMHIISNNNADQNSNLGLFGTVSGSSSNWAAIQNLVIENAEIVWSAEKENVNAVGIVAGQVDAFSKLQNLIVRNSAIEHLPGLCAHGTGNAVNIGGVVGSVGSNKVNYNIHNIASNVDIMIDDAYTSASNHKEVRVGGIFGLLYQTYDISSIDNNFARDLYYQGILDVASIDKKCLVGTIFGEGSEDAKKKNARVNWYYANGRGVKSEDQGSQSSDFEYIKGVFNTSLEILYEQNSTALFGWTVNDEKNQFAFDKINVEETAYNDVNDVYTLTAKTMLQLTDARYEWYILSEAKNSIEQSLLIAETSTNKLSLSYMLSGYKVFVKVYEGSRLRAASLLHELSDRVCDVNPTHSGTTWYGPKDDTKAGTYSYEWYRAGAASKEGESETSKYVAKTTSTDYQLRVLFKNSPDYPVYSTHVLNTNAYELIDGQVYNEKNGFDTKKFTYKRTFNNTNWQAFILPVGLDYTDWSDRFEMAEFYDVNVELNATETGFVGSFVQVKLMKPGSKTVANVPYMIRLKDKSNTGKELSIVKTGAKIHVGPATPIDLTCSDIERDFTFRATYVGIAAPGLKNRYAMSSGSWKTSSTASLSAERVYLEVKERTFKQKFFTDVPERHAPELRVRIVEDDEMNEETAIEQIADNDASAGEVTTVSSSFIGLSVGTYHINGKTVVVK